MVLRDSIDFRKFGETIVLPFSFHIKDVKQDLSSYFNVSERENILEEYSADLYGQREYVSSDEYNMKLLECFDLKNYPLELDKEDLEEYGGMVEKYKNVYIFKNHTHLYSFLIEILKFNETDFKVIERFVMEAQLKLRRSYEKMLVAEIDIGNPKEDASESYMILRCAFELNRPPIFKENVGLAIEEHSWREMITQRIYMGRKCEIEKIQYDNISKKNK
ncbi:MAG: hypothetical protein ACRCZ1_02970 [Cetobacterium sp.]